MIDYKVKVYQDCGIRITATKEIYGRYVEPYLWTRYHLYVAISHETKISGTLATKYTTCHFGFDSKKTAEKVWNELVMRIERCEDKISFVKEFYVDDLNLEGYEGRIIKYIEGGKIFSVFPKKDRLNRL